MQLDELSLVTEMSPQGWRTWTRTIWPAAQEVREGFLEMVFEGKIRSLTRQRLYSAVIGSRGRNDGKCGC